MKFQLVILLSLLLIFGSELQSQTSEKINWITFEEAVEKSKIEKKKIFIDVYTDWCGWCKVMDKKTFNNDKIASYLSQNFYTVKLNAEQREDITFNGTTFKFVPSGSRGYHQLAAALLNGKLSYPSVVFLDENFNMLQPLTGYQAPEVFHPIIKFIGEEHYKTTKWAEFQENYQSPF